MKRIHQIIYCSFALFLAVSCKPEQDEKQVVRRPMAERRPGYPKVLGQLRDSLYKVLDSVDISASRGYTDSVWTIDFVKMEKTYGAQLFYYRILPKELSDEKRAKYAKRNMMASCMTDPYASKKFVYKNYFLEPGCGHITEENKHIVDAFYKELDKIGAKETKDDFWEMSRNHKQ